MTAVLLKDPGFAPAAVCNYLEECSANNPEEKYKKYFKPYIHIILVCAHAFILASIILVQNFAY